MVKQEKDLIMADVAPADKDEDDEDDDLDMKPGRAATSMLDYGQYYPTVLPMRPPRHEAHGSAELGPGAAAVDGDSLPVRAL